MIHQFINHMMPYIIAIIFTSIIGYAILYYMPAYVPLCRKCKYKCKCNKYECNRFEKE